MRISSNSNFGNFPKQNLPRYGGMKALKEKTEVSIFWEGTIVSKKWINIDRLDKPIEKKFICDLLEACTALQNIVVRIIAVARTPMRLRPSVFRWRNC